MFWKLADLGPRVSEGNGLLCALVLIQTPSSDRMTLIKCEKLKLRLNLVTTK